MSMGLPRYVICDIEATGLDEESEPIEIALITYENGKVVEVYETFINPLRPLTEYISNLTMISNRDLLEAPKFYDVADAIRTRLEGSVFVSHNTKFDLGMLRRKFREMGQELKIKSFCTLKVAQNEIPGLRNYNLDALCSFFGIKNTKRHRAIGDAQATLEIFKELHSLRLKTYQKILYLPHHEKALKKMSTRAGLLMFKNEQGKVIHFEAAFNMEKKARELLEVKEKNRDLLKRTDAIECEPTGLALIAEFKKLLFHSNYPHWMIVIQLLNSGEKTFKIRPFKKGLDGLWYFEDYLEAKEKLRLLQLQLKDHKFAYRDGEKSKEEILKHNAKVMTLIKETMFPADNLIILGEGRKINEKSFVLIRNQHVLGFGYAEASDEDIYACPENYLSRRFFQHLGADLVAKKYIRIIKNLKTKNENWRSLAEVR